MRRGGKEFQARYELDDGYAGGARPQYCHISVDEIRDELTSTDSSEEIQQWYENYCFEKARGELSVSVSRESEFEAWVRDVLGEEEAP